MAAVKTTRRAALKAGVGWALGAAPAAQGAEKKPYPWRVWDAAAGRNVAWEELPARLAGADAVFVGEQHDDPETHRAEAALLAALHGRTGDRLTLAMEMLERDGQPALDEYLAGKIGEDAFAKAVTLWPNYPTDYRPLVEWARERRVPVLASNVPQRIARAVSKEGLGALAKLPARDRPLAAAYVSAPEDASWERFRAVIGTGHGGPEGRAMDPAMIRRFYEAQCLKDDTMAETVARALGQGRRVLHVNGAFHSDRGQGVPARVLWRRPLGTRLAVVTIAPVRGELARAETGKYQGEADYAILVPDRRPQAREG